MCVVHDEWQDIDAEAAQITVVSQFHCTVISATGIDMLDGMLTGILLTFSCAVLLIVFHLCCWILLIGQRFLRLST